MKPLHSLLTGNKSKFQTLTWTHSVHASFNATKEALANRSLLSYPRSDAPICLMTVASNSAVGAVLQQHFKGTWHPISFFSRKMTTAETRYSTFDRELLAIYLSIKHFTHFLEGRPFHVLTDHKPLTFAPNTRSNCHSPRQARQLDYISQFTSTIRHIHSPNNVVADALSRIETNALLSGQPPTVDFVAIATSQALVHHNHPHPQPSSWNLSHSQTLTTLSIVTFPLATNDPSSHSLGDAPFSTLSTDSHTLASEQLKNSSLLALFGLVSTLMFVAGLAHVYSVNVPRFNVTRTLQSQPFQTLTLALMSSTSSRHYDLCTENDIL